MKYHCRCRTCGARQVRHRHPDDYTRGPRCRHCGGVGSLRVDRWANTRIQATCGCDAYHFTHRLGSGLCFHRVFDREAFEERAAVMEFDGGMYRDVAERLASYEQRRAA